MGNIRNLKTETINRLVANDKTLEDIRWVGCRKYEISVELFLVLADQEYDAGYGGSEVADDLLVVGDDWWLERHEYDGSEWWEFKTLPKRPDISRAITSVFDGDLSELDEEPPKGFVLPKGETN